MWFHNGWISRFFDLVSENIGVAQSVRVPENPLNNAFLETLEEGICGFWFIEKIRTVTLVVYPFVKEFVMNTLRGYWERSDICIK